MTKPNLTRVLAAVAACAALASPAMASALPGPKPHHGGKDGAKRNPVVMYVFKGKVADVQLDARTIVLTVRKVNHHGHAFRGLDVAFDVSQARVVAHGGKRHGTLGLAAVSAGDEAVVHARLPKRRAGDLTQPVAAKGVVVKHAKIPGLQAPAAP